MRQINLDQVQFSFVNQFIVFAIYVSVFVNSIVLFQNPFEFYIGYLVYLVLMPVFLRRHQSNKVLLGIFTILLVVGIINIFQGNDTVALFFKVFAGLLLSYIFYDYVIKEFDFDIELLIQWYMKGAYYVSIIGVVQFISFLINFEPGYDYSWILNKSGFVGGGNFGIRVNSIFAEPTYLASSLSAAFFIAVYNITRKEPVFISKVQSSIIIVVYFLSFSGLAQAGILLTVLFLLVSFGFLRYLFVMIPLAIFLFNILYNNVGEFRERYDGIVSLFGGDEFKLGKTHGSSFILYNNYRVTIENFKSNFAFGSGIGSHPVAFEKYSIAKNIKVIGFSNNSADANSMLLRLFSETGLFGVGIFLFIIFKFYVGRDDDIASNHWLISNAILVMILLNLFRQGHYFLNGFPFFVLMYVYNYFNYQKYIEEKNISQANTEIVNIG
jgi:hypothetical protein